MQASLYLTKEITLIEKQADDLMSRAGQVALITLLKRWPEAKNIIIFCGGGNNGGDGYVMADLAKAQGMTVKVVPVEKAKSLPEDLLNTIKQFDVVVDAICGTGLRDRVSDQVALAIQLIEQSQVPVLAIDVPTGLYADTGAVLGLALHATATITFIGVKLGLVTGVGRAYCGDIYYDDLALSSSLLAQRTPVAALIDPSYSFPFLKERTKDWHKGLSGHVLVVGGAEGYLGAAGMAAEAALRVGAGLVSVAAAKESASVINSRCPEVMVHEALQCDALAVLLKKASVVVMGPGLSRSSSAKQFCEVVFDSRLPMVVDADALNILADNSLCSDYWILTPHPGEAARLLKVSIEEVQANRLKAAEAISQKYGGVCVLKGSGSLVVGAHALPAVCYQGNPGMASGGMGDVLSGVIGGLLAQGMPPIEATAKLGVYLHAKAGDMAASEGERGMVATDLMPYLRQLVSER